MERRTCATVAALFLLCAAANQGRGDVNLMSAELSTGRGFLIIPRNGDPSSSQATTFAAPVPFPNDQQNFAGVGPDGLTVRVNRRAMFSHHLGNTYVDDWTAERFQVTFELDGPAQYTYQRSLSGGDDSTGVVRLNELQMPLFLPTSGTLPAGRYTLSGTIDLQSFSPTSGPGYLRWADFQNIRFTVTPEPAALPVIIAGLCSRADPGGGGGLQWRRKSSIRRCSRWCRRSFATLASTWFHPSRKVPSARPSPAVRKPWSTRPWSRRSMRRHGLEAGREFVEEVAHAGVVWGGGGEHVCV